MLHGLSGARECRSQSGGTCLPHFRLAVIANGSQTPSCTSSNPEFHVTDPSWRVA